jgi:NB-ARC domain
MTIADSNKLEEEFIEAKNNWDLEKMYIDLASAKGKALTPVEKKFLRGLLCGFSPAEIANAVYKSRSSSTVRVYLSNGLYKYLEEMLSNQTQTSVKVKNWSRVTHLLEKAGYKKAWHMEQTNNQIITNIKNQTDFVTMKSAEKQDWGEAIDVSIFHGRTQELAQAKQWIVQERCRLVVLLGLAGVGKTALSVKLAEQIQEKFEYVIWRSLSLAPPLEVFLNKLIQILSKDVEIRSPGTLESLITQLIECLRTSRCLIVLDSVDSILGNETLVNDRFDTYDDSLPTITYRQGYEGYGELIRRLGGSQHQSCLVLTSREKPQEIAALEGEKLPVRSLKLTGLSQAQSREILNSKGFAESKEEECKVLIDCYGGNPLFLKLVATTIQELFGGNIDEFLEQDTIVFGDIREILDQQFNRLSALEKQILYWLTLNQNFVSLRKMQKDMIPRVSQRLMLEAIELLQRRCLIEKAHPLVEASRSLQRRDTPALVEKQAFRFQISAVLITYIAERIIEDNFKLREEKVGSILMSHTIFEAQLKNYIREQRLKTQI